MDKKKIIGTIIGVIMFAVLIAGATYAWLTFNATVTNATYNGTTLNYWVDYSKGTDLSDIPILTSPTTENASFVKVTAKKPTGSIANNITIKLTTTSNGVLTKSGAVHYAICKGTCATNFTGAYQGTITSAGTINLLTDNNITSTLSEYYVYFWLDAATITTDHLGDDYAGYIHASSTQDTTNNG